MDAGQGRTLIRLYHLYGNWEHKMTRNKVGPDISSSSNNLDPNTDRNLILDLNISDNKDITHNITV